MTLSLVTALMFVALAILDAMLNSMNHAVALPAHNRPPRLDQHNAPSLIVMKSIRK